MEWGAGGGRLVPRVGLGWKIRRQDSPHTQARSRPAGEDHLESAVSSVSGRSHSTSEAGKHSSTPPVFQRLVPGVAKPSTTQPSTHPQKHT